MASFGVRGSRLAVGEGTGDRELASSMVAPAMGT